MTYEKTFNLMLILIKKSRRTVDVSVLLMGVL